MRLTYLNLPANRAPQITRAKGEMAYRNQKGPRCRFANNGHSGQGHPFGELMWDQRTARLAVVSLQVPAMVFSLHAPTNPGVI